jgi:hypothetical protein
MTSSMFELALFAVASLGVVLSSRVVLRMMRSRAVIARKSHRI